jgi:hypothetical protein
VPARRARFLPLLPVLFRPELHDPPDQRCRQRLVEGELHRTFPALVFRQLLFEPAEHDPARPRVKPYVTGVSGEIHEVPVQGERRHLVADLLQRLGGNAPDELPQLRQLLLDLCGE